MTVTSVPHSNLTTPATCVSTFTGIFVPYFGLLVITLSSNAFPANAVTLSALPRSLTSAVM